LKERNKINMKRALQFGLFPIVIGLFIMISFAAYQSNFINEVKNQKRLPTQAEVLIKEIVKSTSDITLKGTTETQKQTLINQVSREVFNQFNTMLRPYWQYAPPVLAFGLFLILWGLSWIFVWLAVAIGLIIFGVLKKTQMVRIEEKEVKAEVLVI
ncbi:hypothetical protein KW791_03200, partial [Candidatus Parcubacteria bacterium]|nr:hypothetical protein [Candidatus Parcubacteria bacterium]